MRVKAVEALAAGKAIVASPLAVEGLDLAHEKQCLLATSDEEFVRAVTRLLREPELRSHLARAARVWACANLGWARPVASTTVATCLLATGPRRRGALYPRRPAGDAEHRPHLVRTGDTAGEAYSRGPRAVRGQALGGDCVAAA